ncbi:aldo-keto reductase family protein [Actinacidiphila oryziradicis]|uniref:hypothetical protein n=1 Tax=Actinacidiphila oryziradicis TaxID=2571141 RepID=UPI002AFEF7A0|nr:hypothetical protein [Actinacidiphila oryziradicis]
MGSRPGTGSPTARSPSHTYTSSPPRQPAALPITIQLPVSLVMATPLAQALHGHGPIADAAHKGLEVFASAPLHGGELPHLATPELAELIRPGLSTAQACLLAVASCHGLTKVLLSATDPAHWVNALAALDSEPLPPEHLRKILDVLNA